MSQLRTNTTGGQLPGLELRRRRQARAETASTATRDTGLTNLRLHDFTPNQTWCFTVILA
jgi:hypothetical protein